MIYVQNYFKIIFQIDQIYWHRISLYTTFKMIFRNLFHFDIL